MVSEKPFTNSKSFSILNCCALINKGIKNIFRYIPSFIFCFYNFYKVPFYDSLKQYPLRGIFKVNGIYHLCKKYCDASIPLYKMVWFLIFLMYSAVCPENI